MSVKKITLYVHTVHVWVLILTLYYNKFHLGNGIRNGKVQNYIQTCNPLSGLMVTNILILIRLRVRSGGRVDHDLFHITVKLWAVHHERGVAVV